MWTNSRAGIRRQSPVLKIVTVFGPALVAACPGAAWAAGSSVAIIESFQSDQISSDPFEYDNLTDGDTQSNPAVGIVKASGDYSTTYQSHTYEIFSGSATDYVGGRPVHMEALHRHHFEMNGEDEDRLWFTSDGLLHSQVSFSDELTLIADGPGMPALTTVEYVWRGTGRFTQVIDIPPGQQPLYSLKERIQFTAGAGGFEETPVDIDVTFYDPDAPDPNPYNWLSLLDDDINLLNQPIPGFTDENQTLSVTADLQSDGSGGYLPVPLEAMLIVESRHKFLNDGAGLNFYLRGDAELAFNNSADLLGIIVRDETGAARTDVTVLSAEGVAYTLLIPEPSSLLLLGAGLTGLVHRGRR